MSGGCLPLWQALSYRALLAQVRADDQFLSIEEPLRDRLQAVIETTLHTGRLMRVQALVNFFRTLSHEDYYILSSYSKSKKKATNRAQRELLNNKTLEQRELLKQTITNQRTTQLAPFLKYLTDNGQTCC
ncbi:MAG: hypothetical protein B7X06_00165, partial [Verrucomicrobia bacterium 21-51-4]